MELGIAMHCPWCPGKVEGLPYTIPVLLGRHAVSRIFCPSQCAAMCVTVKYLLPSFSYTSPRFINLWCSFCWASHSSIYN